MRNPYFKDLLVLHCCVWITIGESNFQIAASFTKIWSLPAQMAQLVWDATCACEGQRTRKKEDE